MDTKPEVVHSESEIDDETLKSTAHDITPIVAGDAGSTTAKSPPTPTASNDTENENNQEDAMKSEGSHHEIVIDISTANDTEVTAGQTVLTVTDDGDSELKTKEQESVHEPETSETEKNEKSDDKSSDDGDWAKVGVKCRANHDLRYTSFEDRGSRWRCNYCRIFFWEASYYCEECNFHLCTDCYQKLQEEAYKDSKTDIVLNGYEFLGECQQFQYIELNGSKELVQEQAEHMQQRLQDTGKLLSDEWDLKQLKEVVKMHCETEWGKTKSRFIFYLSAFATLTSAALNVWFLSYKVYDFKRDASIDYNLTEMVISRMETIGLYFHLMIFLYIFFCAAFMRCGRSEVLDALDYDPYLIEGHRMLRWMLRLNKVW